MKPQVNIESFKNSFKGFSKASRYYFHLNQPQSLIYNRSSQDLSFIPMLAESVEMPGRDIATRDHDIYGFTRKMPYRAIYSPFTVNFYCDVEFKAKKFFDAWHTSMFSPNRYYWRYHQNYITTAVFSPLNDQGLPIYTILIDEIFPISVSPISFSYGSNNQISTLSVVFAYKDWLNLDNAITGGISTTPDDLSPFGIDVPEIIENLVKKFANLADEGIEALEQQAQTALSNLITGYPRIIDKTPTGTLLNLIKNSQFISDNATTLTNV